jgi:phosphate transport system ATP-binding protein
MYLGEIIEQGTAAQVFDNPSEEMTKAYMQGSFN